MTPRSFLCLTLIILIAVVSIYPMPVGDGPRSTVYGPATAFRAHRAALQLRSAVSAALVVLTNFSSLRFSHSEHWGLGADSNTASVPLLSLLSILRC